MDILTSRRFGLWWSLASQWFSTKFTGLHEAISQISVSVPDDIAKEKSVSDLGVKSDAVFSLLHDTDDESGGYNCMKDEEGDNYVCASSKKIGEVIYKQWYCNRTGKTLYTGATLASGNPIYTIDGDSLVQYSTIVEFWKEVTARKSDIPSASAIRTEMEKQGGRLMETEIQVGKDGETEADGKTSLHAKMKTLKEETSKANEKLGTFVDGKSVSTELASISQELGNLRTEQYKGLLSHTMTTNASGEYVAESNVLNLLTASSAVTIAKGEDIVSVVNDFEMQITIASGGSVADLNWGATISWNGGNAPSFTEGKTYVISIVNNIGLFAELEQ